MNLENIARNSDEKPSQPTTAEAKVPHGDESETLALATQIAELRQQVRTLSDIVSALLEENAGSLRGNLSLGRYRKALQEILGSREVL